MSFEITDWDGLAKCGTFTVNEKVIHTPALFPVVHPSFQDITPQDLKKKFGYSHLITSTY